MTRFRRVESRKEQERLVEEFVTKGYTIQQQGQYTAKVKEKDWGDIPIHFFLALLTLVVGAIVFDAAGVSSEGVWILVILLNVGYAAFSRITAEEIIIKVDDGSAE